MLPNNAAKAALTERGLSRNDSFLLVLSTFDLPTSVSSLRERSISLGYKIPSGCNPSSVLSRAFPLAIQVSDGWELTKKGLSYLQEKFPELGLTPTDQPMEQLRAYAKNIPDQKTRVFVEEAIGCCEHGLLRSAIVMSWLAAVYVLQLHIIDNRLDDFNSSYKVTHPKAKPIKVRDDFRRIREELQIDLMVSAHIVESGVGKELKQALIRRNNCGHPSSVEYERHTVASHLAILLENIFLKL